jgi:hypothetical protein
MYRPGYTIVSTHWVVDARTRREIVCFNDLDEALECLRKCNDGTPDPPEMPSDDR